MAYVKVDIIIPSSRFSETFLDNWVQKVAELHQKYPDIRFNIKVLR